jgi:serine/threonine protein phosphatase PrpC
MKEQNGKETSGSFVPKSSRSEDGEKGASAHAVLSRLSWAYRSHPGAVRLDNEDYVGVYAPAARGHDSPVFVLADGMGGHAAGEVASQLAAETVLDAWMKGRTDGLTQALRGAVRAANQDVYTASFDDEQEGMGTTLTALALSLDKAEAFIAHIGDSRAYRVRRGTVVQLTTDHSRAAEMLRAHLITAEQAVVHPARSSLTRSIGNSPGVHVETITTDIELGDVFLLCSDGLWDMVTEDDIREAASAPTPVATAEMLLHVALEEQAADNVSAVVVRITKRLYAAPGERPGEPGTLWQRFQNRLRGTRLSQAKEAN